ncbi:MAG: hypothetical protein AAGI34_07395 [Pseudomonadota bacterium]
MAEDTRYRPDLTRKAKQGFARANPTMQASRTPRDNRSPEGIAQRAERLRAKATVHTETMRPRWIKAETKRLKSIQPPHARLSRAGGPKPPSLGPTTAFAREQSLAARAEANVQRRASERLDAIDHAARRMVRTLTRSRRQTR